MEFKKSISKEQINQLPLYQYRGHVEVIDSKEKALIAARKLQKHKILGFDTETRPSFKKGEYYDASLLQLGTDSEVYLFRLRQTSLIPEVIEILESSHIIKTGVAINDDIKALKKFHNFSEKNFVDLATMAKKKGIENFGLRALVAIFLSKRLSKREQTSNWDRKVLTESQISYAASDAAVGYKIYKSLIHSEN